MNDYEKAQNIVLQRWTWYLQQASFGYDAFAYPAPPSSALVNFGNAAQYLDAAVREAFVAGANWGLQRNTKPIKIDLAEVKLDEVREDRG